MEKSDMVVPGALILIAPHPGTLSAAIKVANERYSGKEVVTFTPGNASKEMRGREWAEHAKFVDRVRRAPGCVAIVDRPLPSLSSSVPDVVVLPRPVALTDAQRADYREWLSRQGRVAWVAHANDFVLI